MYISYTKSFNIPVSIALATLAYMINVYEICLNTTNCSIFNMQDFIYCLWTSILDCFGQLVSPPKYYSHQAHHYILKNFQHDCYHILRRDYSLPQ